MSFHVCIIFLSRERSAASSASLICLVERISARYSTRRACWSASPAWRRLLAWIIRRQNYKCVHGITQKERVINGQEYPYCRVSKLLHSESCIYWTASHGFLFTHLNTLQLFIFQADDWEEILMHNKLHYNNFLQNKIWFIKKSSYTPVHPFHTAWDVANIWAFL